MRVILAIALCAAAVSFAADKRLERGKRYLDDGELDRAIQALRPLVDDARLSVADRAEARLFLSAALFGKGEGQAARLQMDLIARTAPDLQPDPARFPPEFVEAFRQQHAAVHPARPGREVASSPPPGTRRPPAPPQPSAQSKRALPKLAILDVRQAGLNDRMAEAASALVASEVRRLRAGKNEVITSADIAVIIGFERQKQLLGCNDDTSCLAEISGALGAAELVSSRLLRAGTQVVAEVRLIDPSTAKVLGSATRTVPSDEDQILGALPGLVAEALKGTAPRPAASSPAPVATTAAPAPIASAPVEPARSPPGGVSPWLWGGAITSTALGGAALVFWTVPAAVRHSAFQQDGNQVGLTRAEAATARIALPASIALTGLGIAGLGYALFGGSTADEKPVALAVPSPGGAFVQLGGSF